jgi:hypothetical protein
VAAEPGVVRNEFLLNGPWFWFSGAGQYVTVR